MFRDLFDKEVECKRGECGEECGEIFPTKDEIEGCKLRE